MNSQESSKSAYTKALWWSALNPFYDRVFRNTIPYKRLYTYLGQCLNMASERQTALDLGCGTGLFLTWMTQAKPMVQFRGYEFDPSLFAKAQQRLYKVPNAAVEQVDLFDEAIPKGHFVFLNFVLHQVQEKKAKIKLLQRVWNLILPGGCAYLVDFDRSDTFLLRLFWQGMTKIGPFRKAKPQFEGHTPALLVQVAPGCFKTLKTFPSFLW